MAKALGIDYGTKRVGIAISDSTQIIATALCATPNIEIFKFLIDLRFTVATWCRNSQCWVS